jgi:hypothetical protein
MPSRSARRSLAAGTPRSALAALLTLATLLACLVAALAAGGARAASVASDLGAPDYSGYCQHLGFLDARFTSGPEKTWGCLHGDGTVTALDIQGACEFSFSQRPIAAKELSPGAIYTWHCLQGANAGGPTSGTGTGTPTSVQLKAALLAALAPSGRGARIAALLRRGYSDRFHALTAGRVSISWYFVPKGAHLANTRRPTPVLVATGARGIAAAGTTTVRIALTAKGRRMLAHAGRLRLTARGAFTPRGGHTVIALKSFTLKR